MNKGSKVFSLDIDALAYGGDGVGRVDGKVCFVPGTVPGDRLKVRSVFENKKLIRAEIMLVEKEGSGRRQSPCELFGVCGGCQWLHIDESIQREAKEAFLSRAVGEDDIETIASPEPLGYRRRARLHYSPGREPAFGFNARWGKEIVDVPACPILDGRLNDCLAGLKHGPLAHLKCATEVSLTCGEEGPVAVVSSAEDLGPEFYEESRRLVPDVLAGFVLEGDATRAVLAGDHEVTVEAGDGGNLTVPAGSFGQANLAVNLALVETVGAWAKDGEFKSAVELFAGAGNFTTVLAQTVGRLATVELDGAACRAAQKNINARGARGITVRCGDSLDAYLKHGKAAQLLVMDPPRTGHAALTGAIAEGDNRAVIYVSCNPSTLGRDLGALRAGGYKVVRARGFDMFPQTYHLEAAVMLERA